MRNVANRERAEELLRKKDEDMVRNMNAWPMWPFLPLKTRIERDAGNMRLAGTYIGPDLEDGTHKVYLTSMFSFDPGAPKRVYQTVNELVQHWMVD